MIQVTTLGHMFGIEGADSLYANEIEHIIETALGDLGYPIGAIDYEIELMVTCGLWVVTIKDSKIDTTRCIAAVQRCILRNVVRAVTSTAPPTSPNPL